MVLNRPAWQGYTVDLKKASYVTDGVITAADKCSVTGNSPKATVINPAFAPGGPWLVVDLGANVQVNTVVIFSRGVSGCLNLVSGCSPRLPVT